MINLYEPNVDEVEAEAVREVLLSKWIGKGGKTQEFEQLFKSEVLGDLDANLLSTSSCTEGIFLALKLFGLGPEDEVILPSISFPAIANAIADCGASPVFCDVCEDTLQADPESVERVISNKTKAVFITHYAGNVCDMAKFLDIRDRYGLLLFEDAAGSPGSKLDGKSAGLFGDFGVWSFDAMKAITCGDGGMVHIKNPSLLNAAQEWLYLGLPAQEASGLDKSGSSQSGWWEYDLNRPGRRSIMNDIAASIGICQINKFERDRKNRKIIFDRYSEAFSDISQLTVPTLDAGADLTHYKYWCQCEDRTELAQYLKDNGVYSTFRYHPLHLTSLYSGVRRDSMNGTTSASSKTINLPLHSGLTEEDQGLVIGLVRSFYDS